MLKFKSLRLGGFKSFVDKTELEIAPGLNGIVGPNGCGKSNLVEALRWVMGESSAKRMRGGGMEDVIFNGTDKRAARNIAEVSLILDNTERTAPPQYNGFDDLEVTRKIERDRGSAYKINGKNARARDVQMLFADTVTGANSPALVSQGQVAKIIAAKPLERRLILEESAGISGLYARRHEAELRLKAADGNLLRIEDILGGMEGRVNSLKRQTRMADRYKNLNAQIRHLDIVINYLEFQEINSRIAALKEVFAQAESLVADKMLAVTQMTKTYETLQKDMPDLRKAEIDVASSIQTKKIDLQRLEDSEARRQQTLDELNASLVQTKADLAHETASAQECETLIAKLDEERESINAQQTHSDEDLKEKETTLEELERDVIQHEERYTAAMQKSAETQARLSSLAQQIEQNQERKSVIEARKVSAEEELAELIETAKDADGSGDFEADLALLAKQSGALEISIETADAQREDRKDAVESARSTLREKEKSLTEIDAEIQMLSSFLNDQEDETYSVVRDDVEVDSGFEKAVSRALGDSLMASIHDDAPFRWVVLGEKKDLPALPDGVKPLSSYVKVPKALSLAVSQIGLAKDHADGDQLVADLKPGQSLVSEDGMFWRWDGYCVHADASDRNAQILEYKNKLETLSSKRGVSEKAIEKAASALSAAKDAQETLEDDLRDNRQSLSALKALMSDRQLAHARAMEDKARQASAQEHLRSVIVTAAEDIETLGQVIGWDQERLEALTSADQNAGEEDTDALQEALKSARAAHQEAVRSYDSLQQKLNTQKARFHAIADERVTLNNRMIRAREREKSLTERAQMLGTKIEGATIVPKDAARKRDDLLGAISELEVLRTQAADKLAEREAESAQTMSALREAESILSGAREKRGGAQASMQGMEEQKSNLDRSIRETFKMAPHMLKDHITLNLDEAHEIADMKRQRESLVQERHAMGPVNLRAEQELQEIERDVGKLLHERNDLIQAIEELRGGIATINKEARERLLGAFEQVNAHFQDLFQQLFGGGRAHLALVDSPDNAKDPLQAGLEIYAEPPGKSLQSLSLLSGGEQTLASIALIFGMFLTNPSPICVLDEIDAPLDDANVERVCDLLDHISERGKTRFLIITHHRLTMARMDRLYGVTMGEKGVSQLVSVDLQQSFDFLEAA